MKFSVKRFFNKRHFGFGANIGFDIKHKQLTFEIDLIAWSFELEISFKRKKK